MMTGAARLQAQPATADLTTVNTNAAAAPASTAKTPFVLQPLGVVKEVLKLQESGTDPVVIKAFIQSWSSPYSLSANDVLRLHNAGVASETLTLLIQHGIDLGAQASAAATIAPPPGQPEAAPPQVEMPPAGAYPNPESPVPTYSAPVYPAPVQVYSYPQYVPVYTPPVYGYSLIYRGGPSYHGHSFGYYRQSPAVHHFPPPRPFATAPSAVSAFRSSSSGPQFSGNHTPGPGNGFRR